MLMLIAAATALQWWQPAVSYDIPGADAASGIYTWSSQTGTDNAESQFLAEPLRRLRTNPVKCICTPREALDLLLKGTEVHAIDVGANTGLHIGDSDKPVVWIWWVATYCRPELAERAPLPPCLPRRPLVIKPSAEGQAPWK